MTDDLGRSPSDSCFKCPEGWEEQPVYHDYYEYRSGYEYKVLRRKKPKPMPELMPKLEVGMTAENEKDIFTIKKLEDNGGGHQKVYFFRQFKGNDWCCSCSIRTLWDRDGKEIWRRGV